MPHPPERLAPGVHRIDTIPVRAAVSVFLIEGTDGFTLVDTGSRGSLRRIVPALGALGVSPAGLARILLTHHHADHLGGLPAIRAWAPGAEVIAPAHEAAIVRGEQPADRPSNAFLRLAVRLQRLPTAPVDRVVAEGDEVGGFRVVATPGHTLGHVSLLRERDGLLLAGDALANLPAPIGLGVGVFRGICADPAGATRSAEKLLAAGFSTIACSHGPPLRLGAEELVQAAVARSRAR